MAGSGSTHRRARGSTALYWASLSLAGALWGDPPPWPSARPVNLPVIPTFEQEVGATGVASYRWHNSQVIGTFGPGGAVAIKSSDERSIRISFVAARGSALPEGEIKSPQKIFYYTARSEQAREQFDRIRYRAIYPGIDLVFVTRDKQLEYNFELSPGADPNLIRIRYDGLTPTLSREGDLKVDDGGFRIVQKSPQAFQQLQGRRQTVPCRYRLRGGETSIELGAYNRATPLTIDPVLNFSTYLGGVGFDAIYGAASDAAGNLYVTGETSSGSVTDAAIPSRNSRDAFIAKLNSTATQVVYLVYLGGSGDDSGKSIAVDGAGNAWVAGVTTSVDFPVTSGALSVAASGGGDGFVAKLDSSARLQYSTYLGGEKADYALSIAVDSTGAAYVAGQTESSSFPTTNQAFQTSNRGGMSDCFVSKLNSTGTALVYSTLLGGSGLDLCSGIIVDSAGNAYVTGTTYSRDFPVQAAVQAALRGTANAFVAKINPGGTGLIYSSYIGGSGTDNGNAITLDSSGRAYIAGSTSSIDFPVVTGASQIGLKGLYNAFVVQMSANGTNIAFSALLGGSNSDTATSVVLDASGRVILGGFTSSPDFPAVEAIQPALAGTFDAFATVVDPNAAALTFSSYVGGAGDDRAYAVLAAPGSKLYLAGITASSNFPISEASQPNLSAGYDAFLLEISYAVSVPISVAVAPNAGSGSAQSFAATFSDPAGAGDILAARVLINNSFSGTNACFLYYYGGASKILYLLSDTGALQTGIPIGATGTLSNSQCAVNVAASSAVLSGNSLTLNLAVTFSSAFTGSKSVYLECQSATVVGAWSQMANWTVPAASPPAPVSISPASGSGSYQTFTAIFSDAAGATDVLAARILINNSFAGTNACFLYYSGGGSTLLYLLSDAGALQGGVTIGSAGTLSNSQCSVNIGSSSATLSGNTLTLNLAVSFNASFSGTKNIYLEAQNATVVGAWQQMGSWNVAGSVPPVPVSVTPNSGTGSVQTFAATFSDAAGASDILGARVLINGSFSGANSCFLFYYSKILYLLSDAGAMQSGITIGTAGTLSNSQCSVNVGASSAVSAADALTLNLAVTFSTAFAGAKNIYLEAQNATLLGGWLQMGGWTVAGSSAPAPVSVAPSSGSGLSQTFTATFSDAAGAGDILAARVLINGSFSGTSGCFLYYYSGGANVLYLLSDAGALESGIRIGSAGTLSNSQCTANVGSSSAVSSGNTLTLSLNLTFTPSFAGAKAIYLNAQSATLLGNWVPMGTWTIPGT